MSAHGQLAPEIGYVHPAGAQTGTTVEVTLGGYDWTPDMQLLAHDPRVKFELLAPPTPVLITEPPYWFGAKARGYAWPLPREFRARLTIPNDVPSGFIRWQVANANGVSPVGQIHVSTYPEVVEAVDHVEPQVLTQLPIAVSGQIRRIEEIDRYQICPTKSGPITMELLARQLTAPANPMALHGILRVRDDRGQDLVDIAASEGHDLAVTFSAEANRKYEISLHDLDFAGDRSYVYRFLITPSPGLVAAYPSAGQRGETRSVEFVGWGLATGANRLESYVHNVSFPVDPAMDTFAFALDTPWGTTRPYSFVVSDHAEIVEGAGFTQLPAAVTGALEVRFGSDAYPVEWKKGDVWQISAKSRKAGLPLDIDLVIQGPDGKELVAVDDVAGSTDPETTFTVPQDGVYRLIVTDRSGHSGDRAASYRLNIERPREDFSLTMPDLFSVPVGATAKLPITLVRRHGFKGPVNLILEGLPAGVTVPADLSIPADKTNLEIEFTCAADTACNASLAQLKSTATLNDAIVTRPVKSLVVAAIMKAKIKITPEGLDDVSKVHRGSTHLFPLLIDRLDGFEGDITLEMTAKQQRHRQGLSGDEFVIAPGLKRVDYPIFVPEWMETTKTSRMILNGAVRVPDPKGNVRTLLQRMEMRVGILPEGALMKLSHKQGEIHAAPGSEVTIPLTISSVPEFRETIRIELVPSESQVGLMSAEPQSISPGQTNTQMIVRLAQDSRLFGQQQLQFRATAQQPGKGLVKSETTLQVEVDR